MARWFIALAYKGSAFAGFQKQDKELTIQGEVDKALKVLLKEDIKTSTSSRTDAGVHALKNYLHFDFEGTIPTSADYALNGILHQDIRILSVEQVADDAHTRFDPIGRKYAYKIIRDKDPFLRETAFHYPHEVNLDLMNEACQLLLQTKDFESFCKKNTDVKTTLCSLSHCEWSVQKDHLLFEVQANRFLRGMVRGLVGTTLRVGREQYSLEKFQDIINAKDCTAADFGAPAHGLCLEEVVFPENYFA